MSRRTGILAFCLLDQFDICGITLCSILNLLLAAQFLEVS
jgi:hypothetical protein